MRKIMRLKINPILAMALISVLATSILSTQLSSLTSLIHTSHANNSESSNLHTAEAKSLPLSIDFNYKIKEKVGDASAGTKYVQIDENLIDSDNSCEFCTYIKVKPGPQGQTGFVYVADKGLDLSDAKSVTFFAMGLDGGEKLKFHIAGKTLTDKVKNGDVGTSGLFKGKKFALDTEEVTLKNDWLPFSVDLTKVSKEQLTGVTFPFAIEISKIKSEQEFYIKHIIYKAENAELNPIVATTETMQNATLPATNTTGVSRTNATTTLNDNATDIAPDNLTKAENPAKSNESSANNTDASDTIDEAQTNDNATTTNTESSENGTSDNATKLSVTTGKNTPPIAKANDDILAYPGDEVILDGLASYDKDGGDKLTYKWTQSDGPSLEITAEDSPTPVVKIPSKINEDAKAVIDLVVSDGKAESKKDKITIFIDSASALKDQEKGIQTQELKPDGVKGSEWKLTNCKNLEDCLKDGKESTFASTGSNAEKDIGKADLLSFDDLKVSGDEAIQVKYVIIQTTASKTGDTGYIKFTVDNEDNFKLISINSNQPHNYLLILDKDPRTGDEWTTESVNSIVAGYVYSGGQSEVKVSELKLIVGYTATTTVSSTSQNTNSNSSGQITSNVTSNE
jgi:hypothetical protein